MVIAPGHTVTEAEILAHCRGHLAHYKCPKSVEFVDHRPGMLRRLGASDSRQ